MYMGFRFCRRKSSRNPPDSPLFCGAHIAAASCANASPLAARFPRTLASASRAASALPSPPLCASHRGESGSLLIPAKSAADRTTELDNSDRHPPSSPLMTKLPRYPTRIPPT